jgi:hypothetical protein
MRLLLAFLICCGTADTIEREPPSREVLAQGLVETDGRGGATFDGRGVEFVEIRWGYVALEFPAGTPATYVGIVQSSYGIAQTVSIGPSSSGRLTSFVVVSDSFGFVDLSAKALRIQVVVFGEE